MDIPISCPKCGYVRQAADTAPAWQCPSCGIAYNKFRAEPAPKNAAPADLRKKSAIIGQGQTVSSGGVYLILLGVGIFVPHDSIWLLVLPLLAMASFGYWYSSYRRRLAIVDAPTSKVATAAQGYVELRGTVAAAPAVSLTGPLTKKPCIWYSYTINEGTGEHARTVEKGTQSVPFILRDETGECLINPQDAELICELCEKWETEGPYREYYESSIRIGDPIYAIGEFFTDSRYAGAELAGETQAVLQAWMKDPKGFFARFDANRDGKIAASELAAARAAARREAAPKAMGGLHTLVKPKDGRPFILMNMTETQADALFRQTTAVHLCLFFIALGFLTYNLA